MNKNKIAQAQLALTLLVWILLFAIPVLFGDFEYGINWRHIFKIWKEYSILLIVFLINRFILMPYLFLKNKRFVYFISIIGVVILFSVVLYIFHRLGKPDQPQDMNLTLMDGIQNSFEPPIGHGPRELIPPYANMLIMSVLLIGFDSGLIFFSKWMISEQNKLEAERESIANKMAFLKNQVSPHFFMNTLNNIHALIDIDSEESKAAIIKLSQMMDYMLYESQSPQISLNREIEFINSYMELMKLRFTDEVDLKLEMPESLPPVKIPPLLTISFIENAFKYGVSYQHPSFIHIKIYVNNKQFNFQIENSIHHVMNTNKNSGIGIENVKKRLVLLFGNKYKLSIADRGNIFKVNLIIPV